MARIKLFYWLPSFVFQVARRRLRIRAEVRASPALTLEEGDRTKVLRHATR